MALGQLIFFGGQPERLEAIPLERKSWVFQNLSHFIFIELHIQSTLKAFDRALKVRLLFPSHFLDWDRLRV